MALSIGIVGLPNVGKSTVFNALTKTQHAAAENYPFCTIEPNRAVVPVPDERIEHLARLAGLTHVIHATVEFLDIAGLVRGASQGEGLGNQFLGHIRDVAAILHVVRCFEDENVVHVSPHLDPRSDIEVIHTELILADLQQLERRVDKLASQAKGDKKAIPQLELAKELQEFLGRGNPIASFPDQESEAFHTLSHDMRFLTAKPVIYLANIDEDSLLEENQYVGTVREVAAEQGAEVIKLAAQLEADLAGLTEDERQEYLRLSGIEASGLDQVIHRCYRLLGLISFFTMNEEQVRSWTIHRGTTAPRAAGVIHTDFEHGFIKAEVVPYETLVHHGSWHATKTVGALRVEGREYVVHDGDVIYFRFNV